MYFFKKWSLRNEIINNVSIMWKTVYESNSSFNMRGLHCGIYISNTSFKLLDETS